VCTDGESGCSNALQQTFPNWIILNCWNHIIRDVECWLKKHGAGKEEITVYKSQVRSLLGAETAEEYAGFLQMFGKKIPGVFQEYFTHFPGVLQRFLRALCVFFFAA